MYCFPVFGNQKGHKGLENLCVKQGTYKQVAPPLFSILNPKIYWLFPKSYLMAVKDKEHFFAIYKWDFGFTSDKSNNIK